MKFLYSNFAKNTDIEISGDEFLHLKARRAKVGDRIDVRNLKDGLNYIYEIVQFGKKSAHLTLVFSHSVENQTSDLILAWAIIEPKMIEKTLPALNELGVSKIIFFYSDFSQKNFKIDFERLERILINSCQQCGRNGIMKLECLANIDELVKNYQNLALIDFDAPNFDTYNNEILVIGAEGGFSRNEREKVSKKYSLRTKNILRSQTAILSVTAKILL